MSAFTPMSALIGGSLIGISAILLMLFNGRIAGISGIMGSLFVWPLYDIAWKLAFIIGLLVAPLVYASINGAAPEIIFPHRLELMIIGGFLVGFGTRLGGGCTSGHGVCGVARLSKRSIIATAVFMAAAIATVFIVNLAKGI